ncbi:AN1-type zinc finger protein 2A-like isoform X2 [Littorina saxatilis]|uniref:AN1-type zinc finger protein 2A-like isoform X2 n=1 Tax=Littorina saxatilis TaxID=31220 RepID=UPI0038B4F860
MEFPDLGKHCSDSTCQQLDFLPMNCDACGKTFCKDHIGYSTHSCPKSYQKDNQVPVCPLCNTPCPVQKGVAPDVIVGRHIDNDCQSDSAKQRRKIYTNKCSLKTCKKKELVPVTCDKCHQNFCLRHRNELDHDCQGFQDSGRGVSKSGAAAVFRHFLPSSSSSSKHTSSSGAKKQPQQTTLTGLGRQLDQDRRTRQAGTSRSHDNIMPGHMTEEEALNMAMQASMGAAQAPQQPTQEMTQQEQEDLMLARALAASEEEERQRNARRTMVRLAVS